MSNNARRNFKSQASMLIAHRERENRIYRIGRPRDRVTGAGTHMRYLTPTDWKVRAIRELKETLTATGLPSNLLWIPFSELTLNDIRRILGWVRACRVHAPAMVVLRALYSTDSSKGIESPRHRADYHTLPWLMRLWPSPNFITPLQASGLRWLVKSDYLSRWDEGDGRCSVVNRVANVKLFEQIRKVSPVARWALLRRLPVSGELTHRDLDWEHLHSINRATMLECVPLIIRNRLAWLDVGFPMVPAHFEPKPKGLAMKTFKAILDWMVDFSQSVEAYDAVVRITLMFGRDGIQAIRFLERYRKMMCSGVTRSILLTTRGREIVAHNAAQKLPDRKVHPDWKNFVVTQFDSKDFSQVMDNTDHVESVCGGVPKSVSEARAKFLQAGVLWDFDLSKTEKDFLQRNDPKNMEMCPHVDLLEGEYRLIKLDYADTRQLTAGRLTDCCQHLGGAGASCAALAWTSGVCGIYAVFKGGRMVAQTFAWRAQDGSLVFDSVEALRDINRDVVVSLFARCAFTAVGRLGIIRVLVGISNYGITKDLANLISPERSVRTPDCLIRLSYSDAKGGCKVICVASEAHYGTPVLPEFLEPKSIAVNQLMSDSGVFCEHCDAEIHPDCEICPVCGDDVSEWVE